MTAYRVTHYDCAAYLRRIGHLSQSCRPGPKSIADVRIAVSSFYAVPIVDLTGTRRDGDVVRARHVAMYLARHLTGRSLNQIGRMFGGRDHTTVRYAVARIDALRLRDGDVDRDIRLIESTM